MQDAKVAAPAALDPKGAAKRLAELKKEGELWVDFARRLGGKVESQHLTNYTTGRHGLSLDVLASVAPQLSDAELVYVVAGRRPGSDESEEASYRRGLRDALATVQGSIIKAGEGLGVTLPASDAERVASRARKTKPAKKKGKAV